MATPASLPQFGDRYPVLREIGAGGMGRVYLARDTKHDRQVAIKVLDPDYAQKVGTQRFLREIVIAARLTHPNIVQLYDSGGSDERLFYVMPYVEGETVRQRLDREKMLPLEDVIRWASEACDALGFAHAQGIVHRDIKPENLLIQGGHLLVADFGIARALDLAAGETRTTEQLVLGTPVYMSPEQATGGPVDLRTDIYSLACVVHEMLVGEPPYAGATPQAITSKKLSGRYPGVRAVRSSISPVLERTLRRALAPVPADRFGSAEEFGQSLRSAAESRNRAPLWRPALVAIAAAGLAFALSRHSPSPRAVEPPRPRVAVGQFDNLTGDTRQDALGIMAAHWVTEGLQRTATVEVVPTLTALAASRTHRAGGSADPVQALASGTGATLVVTGAFSREGDTLVIQSQLADARTRSLVGAVEPIRVTQPHLTAGLQQLRERLMGLLAISVDERVIRSDDPPTYPAYQAFSAGLDAYLRNRDSVALAAFEHAYELDTTFVLALLYAAFCHTNRRDYASADSVLRLTAPQRTRLSEHDRHWLDYQVAELAGKRLESVEAIRRAAEMAPSSKAVYNFAAAAYEARRPFPAESALQSLPPDVASMRGWLPYWDQLATAQHAQGKHRQELKTAGEARRRFPDRIEAYVLEARALGAEGRVRELEALWSAAGSRTAGRPAELGLLALEAGRELRAHGRPAPARGWLRRAYDEFGRTDERWGRMQAAAALGLLNEAFDIGVVLTRSHTKDRDLHLGLLGIVAARLGNVTRARAVLEELAADRRPFTLAEPQFQAARIAAELGDYSRAEQLLGAAVAAGYPYDVDFHRDESLAKLRSRPIYRNLDIQAE